MGHKGYEYPSRSNYNNSEATIFNKNPISGYCGKVERTPEVCYKRQRDQEQSQHRSNKSREEKVYATDVVLIRFEKESKIN